jgi:hypothetical protein
MSDFPLGELIQERDGVFSSTAVQPDNLLANI